MLFCFLHTLFVEEVPLFIEDDHHESFLLTSPFSFYVFAFPKLEHGAGLKTLDSISVYDLEIILRGLKKFFFGILKKLFFVASYCHTLNTWLMRRFGINLLLLLFLKKMEIVKLKSKNFVHPPTTTTYTQVTIIPVGPSRNYVSFKQSLHFYLF